MKYVQYGSGLSCPDTWDNYDSSPTLRFQKLPLIGSVFRKASSTKFPKATKYGDIVKGLPVEPGSCKGLYCSHVLEHLALEDLKISIKNSYDLLEQDGIFRIVMPDLDAMVRDYAKSESSDRFMRDTLLGYDIRPRGFVNLIKEYYGNARHKWLWNYTGIRGILLVNNFTDIRRCEFNDSEDKAFLDVEDADRFNNALCVECKKGQTIAWP